MNRKLMFVTLFGILIWAAAQTTAQTTTFTHQSNLGFSATYYDLQFKLFDAASGGTQLGSTVERLNVAVNNGEYTVNLDFSPCSSCLNGADRFLEVGYRPAGGSTYITLATREPIVTSPYSIRSSNSAAADGLSAACVNCVNSSQIVSVNGGAVTGTIPVSGVPAGSGNYIQNSTTQQAANFNISGTGSANVLNAGTQFNLNGLRVLYVPSWDSVFVGSSAGLFNTGWANSFFGGNAGFSNTSGFRNSFFGSGAGQANTTGVSNSFFGEGAGFLSTTASLNSFFGEAAGNINVSGERNAFFGAEAGRDNSSGSGNSFFGTGAGRSSKGSSNTFIGDTSGLGNTTGEGNTLIGQRADVGASNLTNATAIGANAVVGQSNSLVLGSPGTRIGIGLTAPSASLSVKSNTSNSGNNTAVFEDQAIGPNASHIHFGTTGDWYIRSATSAGRVILQDTGGNVGIGTSAPQQKLHVDGNEILSTGSSAGFKFRDRGSSSPDDWVWYSQGNIARFWRAGLGDIIGVTTTGNVGIGTSTPNDKLDVNGFVRMSWLSSAGNNYLCRNASYQVSLCSSSLRYKTNIAPFSLGLSFINRLRPITFDWEQSGTKDVGFGAEDVAQVNPLFVTYNDKGEVEGVKYDRLSVAFVNALKEQQAQIEQQQKLIETQQQQIEALKKLVCATNRDEGICKQ